MTRELFLWFFIIICIEALALYCIKMYSVTRQNKYLYTSMFCYLLIPLFLYKLLQIGKGIGIVNVIWNILSTIYGFMIGVLLFSENINSMQILGSILGVIGITLILWDE